MKIIATGFFFGPKSFFRVGWNYVDVFIILTGLLFSLVPPLREQKACTILLMFRSLKLAYATTPMRRMMTPWLHALAKMLNVFAVLVFVILAFAAAAVGLFGGNRYFRCRTAPEPVRGVWEVDESVDRLCSAHGYGSYDCPEGTYCGTPYDYGLTPTHDEQYGSELVFYGAPGYENIFRSFLATFQVVTFDDWAKMMYRMQDSNDAVLSRIFFPCFIFVGSFLCMNLIVAVIVDTFQSHREVLRERDRRKVTKIMREQGSIPGDSQLALRSGDLPVTSTSEVKKKLERGKANEDGLNESADSPERDGVTSFDKICERNTKSTSTKSVQKVERQEKESVLKDYCIRIRRSRVYKLAIIGVILFNLLALALNRKNITDTEITIYNIFDAIIVGVFFLEMGVELGALGLCCYTRTRYIDIFTNILNVAELALTWSSQFDSTQAITVEYSVKAVVVGFRVLRTLKLAGKWEALTETLNFLWETSDDILHFSILLAFFIFLFATIGLALFAHQAKLDSDGNVDLAKGESVRVMNYDTIGSAFLAVFTIQITDNWTPFFYLYTRFSSAAYFFFPLGVFTLNIIMMNLFVAILLEKFFSDDQKQQMAEEERRDQAFNERQKKIKELSGDRAKYKNRVRTLLTALKAYNAILSLGSACRKRSLEVKGRMVGRSLNCFGVDSKLRRFLHRVVYHRAFVWLSRFFVALNSVVLSLYVPSNDPRGKTMTAIGILDVFITLYFSLEIIAKIIVSGFINNGPKSFLKDAFNVVDFSVTLLDIVNVIYIFENPVVAKIFKFIRSLRLFRFINMNKGFRLRVKALSRGIPKIMQTFFIIILFTLMFSIVGVQLFKNLLRHCSGDNIPEGTAIDTEYDCLNFGGEWSAYDISFDNVALGCITLFELFTGKSWCNLVTYLSDIYDYGYQGRRDVALYNLWFPVTYMVLGFICFKSMLTSVISNAFYFHNEALQGLRELTGVQRRWVSLTKVMFKANPIKSYDPSIHFYSVYKFLKHRYFQAFIKMTIVLNGIVLCMEMYKPPRGLEVFCDACHYAFLAVYAFESGLKLFFYQKDFFLDSWSIYDLAIIVSLTVNTIIYKNASIEFFNVTLYILRTLKIFTLFHKLKILRDIFQVFVLALPSVINSALLFLLMVYIFAVVGNCFLPDIKFQTYLDEHCNFESLAVSFLAVFRLSTYDAWNDLMHDAMREKSPAFFCVPNPTHADIQNHGGKPIGCGNVFYSLYFILCILVIPFMFLNIFMAIVVASITEIAQLSESVLSDERLGMFLAVWRKYDPRAEGFVEYSRVWNFLYEIPEPLGASGAQMNNRYYSAMSQWMLQLRIFRSVKTGFHYVSFYDMLEGLVKKSLYKPQTLDKIYNNLSKDMLIKGLQELWDQRTQLAMDSGIYMNRIEDLHYYYELKKSFEAHSSYKVIKVNLPSLVWIILKISKQLKTKVKESRKKLEQGETHSNLPALPDYVNQMSGTRDREDEQDNSGNMSNIVGSFIERTVTREVDELTATHFGGQKFEHNVPKLPNKVKSKRRSEKKRKHNVPRELQANRSRFRTHAGEKPLAEQ